MVGEIAQLSKSDVDAGRVLRCVHATHRLGPGCCGGRRLAAWARGIARSWPIRSISASRLLHPRFGRRRRGTCGCLHHVARAGEPQLVPPMSGAEGDEAGGNPTSYLLVLAPLTGDGTMEGVIEVFQRPDSQPATQRGYLRFLIQMCELASEWLKSRKLKHFSNRHSLWAQADQFARMVHENLDVRETAYTIVNEGTSADRLRPSQRGDQAWACLQGGGDQRPGYDREPFESW